MDHTIKYMKPIELNTVFKKMLADIYTPVGIYLRLRDRFRDTILLESSDTDSMGNSFSFICVNAIAGIEIKDYSTIEIKFPGRKPEREKITEINKVPELMWSFMQAFHLNKLPDDFLQIAQGLFGYTAYDSYAFFDAVEKPQVLQKDFPLMRYRLYQYVIAINHFKDEMYICENKITGIESHFSLLESLIKSKDVPVFPFKKSGDEQSSISDEIYKKMVRKGIAHTQRGDVFQVVLSRKFSQAFTGDEFNVYRSLRSINPSPYLFYFDYGDYKIFGSSPESQLILKDGKAFLHPIAGTIKRTGDTITDLALAEKLKNDVKENAEHTMLVDLARNDLSRVCLNVTVSKYKVLQLFSHVIHLTSEVSGDLQENYNPFNMIAATFPAGTLSGAPKIKAMQIIQQNEPAPRGFYGGCIGAIGFNGDVKLAILIRTFLSKSNTLHYQAGAGIVVNSIPENELNEVENKLGALKNAIEHAASLHPAI
ncbi:MAG: anthranilate synthase component I family protein [Chitinophagaceae bacterium]